MKLTNVKAMVAKGLTVGLLAGAFVLAAPAKAEAQQFAIGVQFGAPVYNGYNNGYNDYYARQRAYEAQRAWAQHEARERHEVWEHQRAYGYGNGNGYGYGNGYGDHDRGRRDRDDHRDWNRRGDGDR